MLRTVSPLSVSGFNFRPDTQIRFPFLSSVPVNQEKENNFNRLDGLKVCKNNLLHKEIEIWTRPILRSQGEKSTVDGLRGGMLDTQTWFLSKGSSFLLFVDFVWKKIYHSCALRGMSKKSCDPFVKKKNCACFLFCFLSKWSKVVLRFNIQTWRRWPRELQRRKRKCHGFCG